MSNNHVCDLYNIYFNVFPGNKKCEQKRFSLLDYTSLHRTEAGKGVYIIVRVCVSVCEREREKKKAKKRECVRERKRENFL